MKKTWIVLVLALGPALVTGQDTHDTDFPTELNADTSAILVKRHGPDHEIKEFHRQHGGKVTRFKHVKWDAVELPPGQRRKIAHQKYRKSGLFGRVQFQRTYEVVALPDDPLFGQQWALTRIDAAAAWDKAATNDVVVAVLDTGVDFDHPDLKDNLWTGPLGEHGYTASGGILTEGGRDDHYHGTHVAGIIAGAGNNGLGIAGLNWNMKVVSFKFLNANGAGSSIDAALCIEKMIDLKFSGVNLRVSNNSWGALGHDPFLEEAFLAAEQAGILNVCAAGNNNLDIDTYSFVPAALPNEGIVSVLASTPMDEKAWFSNFGVISTDLLAPGLNILSCKPGNDYWLLSGTSMAAPHVAAATAMLFSFNPGLLPAQAKTILLQPESYDQTGFAINSTGGGRLNLNKLWNNPSIGQPPPPNHPPSVNLEIRGSPERFTPPGLANFHVIPPASSVMINAYASDADNDPLTFWTTATAFRDNWLPEIWWERPYFAFNEATNQITVSTLPLALDQRVHLQFTVTDGRGGGARLNQTIWSYRDESKVRDLNQAIQSFRAWFDADGKAWFRLDVDTNQVPQGHALYSIEVRPQPSPWGHCCPEPNQDIPTEMVFPGAGAYTARAFLLDRDGNFATSPQAHLVVSNSPLVAPVAHVKLNAKRGVVPFTVVADMTASVRNSATQLHYGVRRWNQPAINMNIYNPVRRFTLTEPGVYEFMFYCADRYSDMEDRIVEFITALPADGTNAHPKHPEPPVKLIAPQDLRINVLADGDVELTWSDDATGEDVWDLEYNSAKERHWSGFQFLASLGPESRSYRFTPDRLKYQFRVRACKGPQCSGYSNIATIHFR